MGSFGERLQREREMRGITLEEIAEATKIGTRSLRALEEQDFDKLPGGIFNKGFVRAYSRYLGLNEEQAVADYLAALTEAQAAGKAMRQEPVVAGATPERPILITEADEREPVRLPLGLIAIVVVVAVVLFGGWRYLSKNGVPRLRHVKAAGQQASAQAPKPTVTQHSPAVAPAPAQPAPELMPLATSRPPAIESLNSATNVSSSPVNASEGFVVRIKARESAWISVVADGKQVMAGILPVDSEKLVRAQRRVILKTGNAAGVELFHNDKLVPPLGGGGEVKTVEFTAAGLRQ